MIELTSKYPYIYVDPEGDEYKFYLFKPYTGIPHISIDVKFKDPKKAYQYLDTKFWDMGLLNH